MTTAADKQANYALIAFDSTHDAIHAGELLAGLGAITVPLPPAVSAGCGIALRLAPAKLTAACQLLAAADFDPMHFSCYNISSAAGVTRAEQL